MAIAAMLGRFGATKDNSPESFMPAVEIGGTGPGKAASRKRNHRRHGWKAGITADVFLTHERQERLFAAMQQSGRREKQIVGSMRGSDHLRTSRRLRAAGLT